MFAISVTQVGSRLDPVLLGRATYRATVLIVLTGRARC